MKVLSLAGGANATKVSSAFFNKLIKREPKLGKKSSFNEVIRLFNET